MNFFFNIWVLSQFIVYEINFHNIYTCRYQKPLHYTTLLLPLKLLTAFRVSLICSTWTAKYYKSNRLYYKMHQVLQSVVVVIEWAITPDLCVKEISYTFLFIIRRWLLYRWRWINSIFKKKRQRNIFYITYSVYLNRILMLLEQKLRKISLKDVTAGKEFSISYGSVFNFLTQFSKILKLN